MDLDFDDLSFHDFIMEFGLSWVFYFSETTFEEIQRFHLPILLINSLEVDAFVSKSIGFDGKVFKLLLYDEGHNQALYQRFNLDPQLPIHLLEPKRHPEKENAVEFAVYEYHGDKGSVWDIREFI